MSTGYRFYLLEGDDRTSTGTSVDSNPRVQDLARMFSGAARLSTRDQDSDHAAVTIRLWCKGAHIEAEVP